MFKIKENTVLDTTGTPRLRNRVIGAIVLGAITMGMNTAQATSVGNYINNNTSQFSTAENIESRDARNTVFLVFRAENGGAVVGSGAIITNSQDTHGHHKIITANHVANLQAMFAERSEINAVKWKPGIYVYNSSGDLLAMGELSATDAPYNPSGKLTTDTQNDIATVKITHVFDDKYDKLDGVELAQNLPTQMFGVQASKTQAFAPGASGGPVFVNGQLVGVLSYTTAISDVTTNGVTHSDDMHIMKEVARLNDWSSMYSKNKEIYSIESQQIMNGVIAFDHNVAWIAPVSDIVLKDLGQAGKSVNRIETIHPGIKATLNGYPSGFVAHYNTTVINPSVPYDTDDKTNRTSWGQKAETQHEAYVKKSGVNTIDFQNSYSGFKK